MKSLTLNVKKEWYQQAERGEKLEEYRAFNDYWKRRLLNADGSPKAFKDIQYKLGYPKSGDTSRTMVFPWRGFVIKTITHPHFNNKPTKVFAIALSNI